MISPGPCPRCKSEDRASALFESSLSDGGETVPAWICRDCGGHWLRAGDLERATETIEVVGVEVRRIPGRAAQDRELICPECREPLAKKRNARDARVVLDACPRCLSTWVDRGELEAVRQEGLLTFLLNTIRFLARG